MVHFHLANISTLPNSNIAIRNGVRIVYQPKSESESEDRYDFFRKVKVEIKA